MAADSFIGYTDTTLTAPAPSNNISSFIGFVDATLTAPGGPYAPSFVGYVDVTLTAPPKSIRPVYVRYLGAWESALVNAFNGATGAWDGMNPVDDLPGDEPTPNTLYDPLYDTI